MMLKRRMTKIEAQRLHEKIWSDPEFKERYDEIARKREKELDELYYEFRKKYVEELMDTK